SGSTARDQYAPVAIPPHCTAPTPTSHRRRQRAVNGNPQRRLPPPKRRSLSATSVPVAPAVLKTSIAALAQPPFPFENQKSDQTPALNLHSLTPPPVRTPPRFPPSRLFGRLPPCIPSRLRLAGIRNPLPIPDAPAPPRIGRFDSNRSFTPKRGKAGVKAEFEKRRRPRWEWLYCSLDEAIA